jgi:glutamate racemase
MNRCGVFDSGIGGLSVAREILKSKLFDEIIYFGDTARVPYGNKNESTIIRYSLEALEFLKNFDIDFLVVACNSASSVAIEELRAEASFPVVGVIEAGVKAVEREDKNSNILLVGTKRTIASNKYQNMLKSRGFNKITAIATPLFVPLVEEGIVEGKIVDEVFKLYFDGIDKEKIDIIILGCTHYPFLEKSFKKHFPNAKLIHSGQAIVKLLKDEYNIKPSKNSSIKLFASDNIKEFRQQAKKWLNFSLF